MQRKKLILALSCAFSASALSFQSAPVIDVGNSAKSIGERVTKLEQMLQSRSKAQINLQQQLDDLQSEVNELRGVTELHSHTLEQILSRQRDLYQELDKRVNSALASQAVPTTSVTPAVTGLQTPAVNYSNNLSENETYERAVNMVLKDRRYEAAIPEFEKFIKAFPDSTYSANAHYWLGQLLFYKADFDRAESEFNLVVNTYKDSGKRPDALLKLGMVAQKRSQPEQAKRLYQQLIEEYPDSSAAKLAATRLSSL